MTSAGQPPFDDSKLSPHPVDALIRELVRSGRWAASSEMAMILQRIATAPFDVQMRGIPQELRGIVYQGERLVARAVSLTIHLVQRVVLDEQWVPGTTEGQYLSDLQNAVMHPTARLTVFLARGGHIALIVAPTDEVVPRWRQGVKTKPLLAVIYSADRGSIVSGYQAEDLSTIRIPREAQWLK